MFNLLFADPNVTKHASPVPKPQPAGSSSTPATPGSEKGEETERASVGDEFNTVLTSLLPWAISILLHLGIILLAFFVVWSAGHAKQEEDIIPEAKLLNDNPSELLVYSQQLDVTATTEIPRDIQTQEVAHGDPLSAVTTETADSLALIGVSGSKALPAGDRKSTRLNSSHTDISRMPSSA